MLAGGPWHRPAAASPERAVHPTSRMLAGLGHLRAGQAAEAVQMPARRAARQWPVQSPSSCARARTEQARTEQAMTHTGGERAPSGFRDQMAGQLRAARMLAGLLERGDHEGLPVLEWTISHNGAQVTGRSYAQPSSARRAALAAWAAALSIRLSEEYHQDSRIAVLACLNPQGATEQTGS